MFETMQASLGALEQLRQANTTAQEVTVTTVPIDSTVVIEQSASPNLLVKFGRSSYEFGRLPVSVNCESGVSTTLNLAPLEIGSVGVSPNDKCSVAWSSTYPQIARFAISDLVEGEFELGERGGSTEMPCDPTDPILIPVGGDSENCYSGSVTISIDLPDVVTTTTTMEGTTSTSTSTTRPDDTTVPPTVPPTTVKETPTSLQQTTTTTTPPTTTPVEQPTTSLPEQTSTTNSSDAVTTTTMPQRNEHPQTGLDTAYIRNVGTIGFFAGLVLVGLTYIRRLNPDRSRTK